MTEQAKKSRFYDFVSRYVDTDFDTYMAGATQDEDYINWHGYCLPFVFEDEEKEYNAVRNGCALFDASPVRKYRIRGAGAGAYLDYVMTRPMSKLPEMRATYAIWCTEDGLLNDDAVLYKFAEDDYLLMAAEVDHDDYFESCKTGFTDVTISEETASLAGFAVQGPKSCAVLNTFGFSGIEHQKPFEMKNYAFKGGQVMVARVGFTADLGYEIWFTPDLCKDIEAAFINAETAIGIQIAGYGLTAIQMCRMEGGLIVPGWDTAQTFEDPESERTPFELGIGWNLNLDREEDFVGKAALIKEKAEGSRYQLKGFQIETECALEDGAELYATLNGQTTKIGSLPSVSWSYADNRWYGLASILTAYKDQQEGFIDIEGQQHSCKICTLPFIDLPRRTQTPAAL